jgi:hypothetical protein
MGYVSLNSIQGMMASQFQYVVLEKQRNCEFVSVCAGTYVNGAMYLTS